MKKEYVIAPYYQDCIAMYESDDFRLKEENNIVRGIFKRTKEVKGLINGFEIGLFYGDNNSQYIIFTDHSAKIYSQGELL